MGLVLSDHRSARGRLFKGGLLKNLILRRLQAIPVRFQPTSTKKYSPRSKEPSESAESTWHFKTAAILILPICLLHGGSDTPEQSRVIDGMLREEAARFERIQAYTRIQHYSV